MDIYSKDPGATLDYAIDWSANLASGDTITSATWTIPADLSKTKESVTSGKAVIWLSGGTVGQTYTVTCRIVTAQGRIDERAIVVRISKR